MGGKPSKTKKRVLPPRHAETPPAWGQDSSPNVVHHQDKDEHDWGNSSYNLLDLQGSAVYMNHTSPTISRGGSEASFEASPIEASLPGSPSVETPRTPSPVKKLGTDEDADKYSFFRNMTDKRDQKNPTPKTSPRKKSRQASEIPRSKKPSTISSKRGSPKKKNSPKKRRPDSLPSSPVSKAFKKRDSPQKRRVSDVSTITLSNPDEDNNNYFTPIPNSRNLTAEPSTKNSSRAQSRENINSQKTSRTSSQKPFNGSGSKQGKVHPGSSDRLTGLRKISQSSTNLSLGSEFTSLKSVKSASHSVQSARSNFELRTKVEKFEDKKLSLAAAGLAKMEPLNHGFKDPKWTSPKAGFDKAKKQLESSEWEHVVDGVVIMVALTKKNPELLLGDLKNVIRLMMGALKNLRSQVSRGAGQAFAEMYVALGKAMELDLDKVVALLLQKAADTNKFIRDSASEALTAMAENVTVFRALTSVSEFGLHSKSVVVRGEVARIFDIIVTQMGAERVMGSSSEFQERVFSDGAVLLTDGSLEVRTHAKRIFAELMSHSKFEVTLKEHVKDNQLKSIQKNLDALRK